MFVDFDMKRVVPEELAFPMQKLRRSMKVRLGASQLQFVLQYSALKCPRGNLKNNAHSGIVSSKAVTSSIVGVNTHISSLTCKK